MIINSYSYATAEAPDVIPTTLNGSYSTYNEYSYSDYHSNNYFQIQAINQPITIKVTIPDATVRLYYKVMNTTPTSELTENPIGFGNYLVNDGTFSISNNQYFVFGGWHSETFVFKEVEITVLNNSFSDDILTFINATMDVQ